MAAIKRICESSSFVKNTGTKSQLLPVATAQVWFVYKDFKILPADLVSPEALNLKFETAMHADRPDRIFPMFGNQVPIRMLTNTKGTDVIVTLDDGTPIFVTYGTTTKQFGTTDGGLCFQKIVQSYNSANMRVIEIDKQGHMIARDNKDGTYGGLIASSIFAPAPDLADLANPAKTYIQIGFNPYEYVGNAVMMGDAAILLDQLGLVDLRITKVVGAIAKLTVDVVDECCMDTVVPDLPASFFLMANWSVKNATTLAVVPITSVTVVGGKVEIAGTFVAGVQYLVSTVTPATYYVAGVEGYETTYPLTMSF